MTGYQKLSGYLFPTRAAAIDYYGSESAFLNALNANILFKVELDQDLNVIKVL